MSLFIALAPVAAPTSQRRRSLARTIAGLGVITAFVIAPAAGGTLSADAAHNSTSSSTIVAGGFEWGAPGRH